LHGRAARRTRLAVAAVDRHAGTERGHLLREARSRLAPKALRPFEERSACGGPQPLDFFARQLSGQPDRREAGAMQDLVAVRVADAAEEPRVGQRALERVALAHEDVAERLGIRVEHLEAAGIVGGEPGLSPYEVQRGTLSRAGLRQHEGP